MKSFLEGQKRLEGPFQSMPWAAKPMRTFNSASGYNENYSQSDYSNTLDEVAAVLLLGVLSADISVTSPYSTEQSDHTPKLRSEKAAAIWCLSVGGQKRAIL